MQFLKMEILCGHGGGMVQIKVQASIERYSATQDVYRGGPLFVRQETRADDELLSLDHRNVAKEFKSPYLIGRSRRYPQAT